MVLIQPLGPQGIGRASWRCARVLSSWRVEDGQGWERAQPQGECLDLKGLFSAQGTQDPSAPLRAWFPSNGGYVGAWREGWGRDQTDMIGFVVVLFSSFL